MSLKLKVKLYCSRSKEKKQQRVKTQGWRWNTISNLLKKKKSKQKKNIYYCSSMKNYFLFFIREVLEGSLEPYCETNTEIQTIHDSWLSPATMQANKIYKWKNQITNVKNKMLELVYLTPYTASTSLIENSIIM